MFGSSHPKYEPYKSAGPQPVVSKVTEPEAKQEPPAPVTEEPKPEPNEEPKPEPVPTKVRG